ncbi:carboxypeptidase regulatory-like domain-containing protein [Salmonella enterica]|nr:carboxypeptidase regulatory-like domain-containing protein [Salmonella enterica]EFR2616414.1 carboxypeptidase regulatory-like domain-containing protein [Salmonella enterica]EHJ0802520.1 carboxypeptidase regulatory-like domain-containing protein [Salmonella enterica]
MTDISGILKNNSGDILALTTITLTETDSKQTLVTTTDTGGSYYFSVPTGTWRITIQQPGTPPKDIGMMEIDSSTQEGALEKYITSLQPSTLDIQVLSFMRGLVSQAERAAAEAVVGIKGIDDGVKASQEAAAQAKQAKEEALKIVGNGKPGASAYEFWVSQQPPGSDTSEAAYLAFQKGRPGADGKSAYEIWTEQQPAGSDTSMTAYMKFQEGKTAASGTDDVKKTDIPAYLTREKVGYGGSLGKLIADGKEGIFPVDNNSAIVDMPESSDYGGSVHVRKISDGVFTQDVTLNNGNMWTRTSNSEGMTDWMPVATLRPYNRPTETDNNPWDYPGSYGLVCVKAGVDVAGSGDSTQDPAVTVIYPTILDGTNLQPVCLSVTPNGVSYSVLNYELSGTWELHSFVDYNTANRSIVLAFRTK